ncbi:MAG: hypothetical protein ABSC01_02255 [Verrucomicrobiota bacterium]|jgi:hypothetical protein
MNKQKPKRLVDLPHFQIKKILPVPDGHGDLRLWGTFNHLSGVREGRSWLYIPPPSIIGDLSELNRETKTAVFVGSFGNHTPKVEMGMVIPWIDGYWNSNLIERILDANKKWIRTKFEPSDAMAFIQNGVRGWGKATHPIPEGSKSLGIVPNGWDHEHCEICNRGIKKGGIEFGYVGDENLWLCPDCYEKYGANQDLSFMDGI